MIKPSAVIGNIKRAFMYFMSLAVVMSVFAPNSANAAPAPYTLVKNGMSLILNWEDRNGAIDYKVIPSINGVAGTAVNTASSEYTEAISLPNTTYVYSVYAVQPVADTDPIENEDVLLFETTPYSYNLSYLSASATRASYNSITLGYTNVRAVSQYEIQRSTRSNSGFQQIATTPNVSYVDSNLAFNATYYYKIRGVQTTSAGTHYTNWSPTVSMRTALNKSTITVNKMNYNSIGVTWTQPDGASYYRLYRSLSESTGYTYLATTKGTSYIDTKLTTGTRYYYKVAAIRGTVKGVSSNPVSGKPTLGNASITRIDVKLNEAKVSWDNVTGATGYKVYRATSQTGSYAYVGSTQSTHYYNTKLANNRAYFYKIKAYRIVGNNKEVSSAISSDVRTVTPKAAGQYYYAKDAFLVLQTDGYAYWSVCNYTVCDWSYDMNESFQNKAYVVVPANYFLTFSASSSSARIIDSSVYNSTMWSSFTKAGQYLVGFDLAPGYYKITSNEYYYYSVCELMYCDWSNGYDDNDLVANGGTRYVYLADGDFLTISGHAAGTRQ